MASLPFDPPEDLKYRVAKYRRYKRRDRRGAAELREQDPTLLWGSLSCWLLAAKKAGLASVRALNNLIYCERGLKVPEFISRFQAESLMDALDKATRKTPDPTGNKDI